MNSKLSAQGWSVSGGKKIIVFLVFLILPFCLANAAEELSERLKGKILLQVEESGEAWYINPSSQKRFYLGRPDDAFQVMREQGLGVSNNDFDSFDGVAPERLAGQILLKVEDNGEAYYVNPEDLKMHYLGRPDDAFQVMREQGLGITNENLNKIEVDEASSPVITEEVEEVAEEPEEVVEDPVEEIATTTEEVIETPEDETATSTEEVIKEPVDEVATTTCVWQAEYFNNKSLFGTFPTASTSVDKIDFDWVRGGPDGIGKVDGFSARFTTDCYFEGGRYEFRTSFDDAIRLYLDGKNFLESWADNNTVQIINRERTVEEGFHEVRVHYYDAIGDASINVDWVKID